MLGAGGDGESVKESEQAGTGCWVPHDQGLIAACNLSFVIGTATEIEAGPWCMPSRQSLQRASLLHPLRRLCPLQSRPEDFRAYLAKGLLLREQVCEAGCTRAVQQLLAASSDVCSGYRVCPAWRRPSSHTEAQPLAPALQGREGDAQRYFIQAKYYAKDNKKLVEGIISARQQARQ